MKRSGGGRVARTIFWASAGTIGATYVAFPVLLLLRGALRPRPIVVGTGESDGPRDPRTPSVSVIIAARNEAASIGARLDNLVGGEERRAGLEVIVASDGSDDGTQAIVASYAERGVQLVDLPRVGKADALNAAVAASGGEILVFTDANSRFAPDAIEALVRPFGDLEVGGVAGDQRYVRAMVEDAIAQGERGYWDLDRMLKVAESRAGNVVSATGAIYAIRRDLFRPVVSGVTDDFVTSVSVVSQGKRLVFAEDAVAFEPPARSGGDEFGRKVRIMTRGLRGTIVMRHLLDPRRYGFYALQLAWHKVLRRLMVVPLLGLFGASLLLVRRGPIYALGALAQLAGYGLGACGLLLRGHPAGRSKVLSLPAFFILVNAAALKAVIDIARGRRIDRWDPVRNAAAADGSGAEIAATDRPDVGAIDATRPETAERQP